MAGRYGSTGELNLLLPSNVSSEEEEEEEEENKKFLALVTNGKGAL